MMNSWRWGRAWHGRSYDLGRMTLPELWRAYLTYPAIQLYGVLAILFLAASLFLARHPASLALPMLAVAFAYPLVWYGIHRFILHGRWLYRMRLTASLWKRIHFDHHQDPHKLAVLFGAPSNTLPTILLVSGAIGFVIRGWPGAAAACSAGLATTCVYEFIHCIQHLNFSPRSGYLKRLKRDHLAHHFHNERGNYGIASFGPDRLLGSYYRVRDVAKSASVFNLGYDAGEAARYPWVMRLTGSPPREKPPPRTQAAE